MFPSLCIQKVDGQRPFQSPKVLGGGTDLSEGKERVVSRVSTAIEDTQVVV